MGGWGDIYRTYLKFDLEGLPRNVSLAYLFLFPYDERGSGTTTPVNLYRVAEDWDTEMVWDNQPSASYVGQLPKPEWGVWWGANITNIYDNWKNDTYVNYGLRLDPDSNDNEWDTFRSSRYTTNDLYRPVLYLAFTPPITVPNFKIPLNGGLRWLVTTETGGWDCKGYFDSAHSDNNYFSVDYSWRNKDSEGEQYFGSDNDIPIIAAAGGEVAEVGTNPNVPNGYYVVVDHGTDGDVDTDFSTRLLHFKYSPSVSVGDVVDQGDLLGYMGDTGWSMGIHLHFGTRYEDNGASASEGQYVVNDSWLLRGFQTECAAGDYIRYYLSSNTATST